jgi:hypothetical protein
MYIPCLRTPATLKLLQNVTRNLSSLMYGQQIIKKFVSQMGNLCFGKWDRPFAGFCNKPLISIKSSKTYIFFDYILFTCAGALDN